MKKAHIQETLPYRPRNRQARPAGEALRLSEERYRVLVENLPVGAYRTTPEGRIVEANLALGRMLGVKSPAALLRSNVKDYYVSKKDRDEHVKKLCDRPTVFTEFELRKADGRRFWARDYCHAVRGPDGKLLYFDGILVDITERKRAERRLERALEELRLSNEELEALSLTDDLTSLNNRRGFFTLGQQQMKIARRLKKDIILLYVDVDDLKQINDTYGHAAGDSILAALGSVLRATLRESDVIGRIGGDEFAVLAMRTKAGSERVLKKRLQDKIAAYNAEHAKRYRLSVSMGADVFDPVKFPSMEDFLAHADFLMYRQKRAKAHTSP